VYWFVVKSETQTESGSVPGTTVARGSKISDGSRPRLHTTGRRVRRRLTAAGLGAVLMLQVGHDAPWVGQDRSAQAAAMARGARAPASGAAAGHTALPAPSRSCRDTGEIARWRTGNLGPVQPGTPQAGSAGFCGTRSRLLPGQPRNQPQGSGLLPFPARLYRGPVARPRPERSRRPHPTRSREGRPSQPILLRASVSHPRDVIMPHPARRGRSPRRSSRARLRLPPRPREWSGCTSQVVVRAVLGRIPSTPPSRLTSSLILCVLGSALTRRLRLPGRGPHPLPLPDA